MAVMREALKSFLKILPLGLLLPLVIGAASIKPDDAMSNLGDWAYRLGIQHVPEWLAAPSTDGRVIAGSIILALLYGGYMWGGNILKSVDRSAPTPTALPTSIAATIRQKSDPIVHSPAVKVPQNQERIFIDATPSELMKMCEGRTTSSAAVMLEDCELR
jgi:hypothetical protein